jgi:hypothetical protein
MGVELKIESPEALALAAELARLTGTSVQDAVTRALRDTLRRERSAKEQTAQILAAAAKVRSHMQEPLPSSDHSWLYGEDGLPA